MCENRKERLDFGQINILIDIIKKRTSSLNVENGFKITPKV